MGLPEGGGYFPEEVDNSEEVPYLSHDAIDIPTPPPPSPPEPPEQNITCENIPFPSQLSWGENYRKTGVNGV